MSRTLARERAFQLIYELEVQQVPVSEQVDWHFQLEPCNNKDEEAYIRSTVIGTYEYIEQIDEQIETHAHNWKKTRISKVNLAILRLAIYEIMFSEQIPDEVAANEAVELSKRYGEDNSTSFINGILSSVIRVQKERSNDGK